jgi:hypothetical protein
VRFVFADEFFLGNLSSRLVGVCAGGLGLLYFGEVPAGKQAYGG